MQEPSDATSDTSEPLPSAAWSQLEYNLPCPLCGYNLRGLSQPRCPECGYRFEWVDVLNRKRRLHRYLYEHHPERELRSFVSTALNGLLPKKFWRSLNPAQPSRPERLRRYWFICAAILIAGACCMSLSAGFLVHRRILQQNAAIVSRATARLAAQFAERRELLKLLDSPASEFIALEQTHQQQVRQIALRYPPPPPPTLILQAGARVFAVLLCFSIVPLVWPWAAFATLLLFRWSMRRARIRPIHVLRCCLYSFDGLWWAGLLLIPVGLLDVVTPMSGPRGATYGFWLLRMLMLTIVAGMWKLCRAYQYYLRFDRPFCTVLTAQFILSLLTMIIWLNLDPTGFGIMSIY